MTNDITKDASSEKIEELNKAMETFYANYKIPQDRQVKKDRKLVIKEKKAKRRLSNKSRKINQAKNRHNKFTK